MTEHEPASFMSDHHATVRWSRDGQPFLDARYSRTHAWSFDGGTSLRASASPAHVPVPLSDPSAVDPEEAFVAALASCHMLVFLHLAARRGLTVDTYDDAPIGYVTREDGGQLALTRVVLRPRVVLAGGASFPDGELARLHGEAHHGCFLARALRAELVVEPGGSA
jgi:organic hydroperoxide reductase OsmC/OhrA